MAFLRNLLVAVIFCSTYSRFVVRAIINSGRQARYDVYTVGGSNHGWTATSNDTGGPYDFQAWADGIDASAYDVLDFGTYSNIYQVLLVSESAEAQCNNSNGTIISLLSNPRVDFSIPSAGQYAFINPVANYCTDAQMKFTISASPAVRATPPSLYPGYTPLQSPPTIGQPTSNPADHQRIRAMIIEISVISALSFFGFLVVVWIGWYLYKRTALETALDAKYDIKDIELGLHERGPRKFQWCELVHATRQFSPSVLLGTGGFGSVYKGSLNFQGDSTPTDIAVKRISATSKQGEREFVAEVKIIGRVQHRNLVRLLGWCHEGDELLLVYDYMPNGSVDQHLYQEAEELQGGRTALTWPRRASIRRYVATALAFLHEDWEQLVIHRDVKASNVMLDSDFNARLGDFGLARMSAHDQALPRTAFLAGTYGYLAPELVHTLKYSQKTDVYSFGTLALEVVTGKRPFFSVEDRTSYDRLLLVDWVWDLYKVDALLEAADDRLCSAYDEGEVLMCLKIGLLCSHPDPCQRPQMREVISIWDGLLPFPKLPRAKPVPVYEDCKDVLMAYLSPSPEFIELLARMCFYIESLREPEVNKFISQTNMVQDVIAGKDPLIQDSFCPQAQHLTFLACLVEEVIDDLRLRGCWHDDPLLHL